MSMVSQKIIHSMAMVGLEKTIGKTIDTNGWNLKNYWKTIDANGSHEKNHWKTIDTNGSHVKNQWKTIDYNGTLTKTLNHSIVVKFLPSFRSTLAWHGCGNEQHKKFSDRLQFQENDCWCDENDCGQHGK